MGKQLIKSRYMPIVHQYKHYGRVQCARRITIWVIIVDDGGRLWTLSHLVQSYIIGEAPETNIGTLAAAVTVMESTLFISV